MIRQHTHTRQQQQRMNQTLNIHPTRSITWNCVTHGNLSTARAGKFKFLKLPHAISEEKYRPLNIRIPETVSCSRGSLLSTKKHRFLAGREPPNLLLQKQVLGVLQEPPGGPPGGPQEAPRRAAGGKPSRRRPAAGGRPLDRLECHWPSFLFHFDRVGVVSRWPLPHAQAESHRKYSDRRPSRRLVQDMEY